MIADSSSESTPTTLEQLLEVHTPEWDQNWLRWLVSQLQDIEAALYIADPDNSGSFSPRAIFPLENAYEAQLMDCAEMTLNRREPILKPLPLKHRYVASLPIEVNDTLHGVVTVVFRSESEEALQQQLSQLEWCSGWVELVALRKTLKSLAAQNVRQKKVLDGIADILAEPGFDHAALRYVNMLAQQLHCDRVVLGFLHRGEVVIHSQSHSSSYSEKHALVKLTAEAMQEAVDQKETIVWPVSSQSMQVTRAHQMLSDILGNRSLLSVPLIDQNDCYGVVLFERVLERTFDSDEQLLAESLANILGEVLEEKRQAEQPLHVYAARAIERQLSRLWGPGFLWRKVALSVTILLSFFFLFAKGEYRLPADAVLEGEELRAIVAPFDSYIENAHARAGDKVRKGQLLAAMDTRELRIQRMSWLSQMTQAQRQYEEALAKQERAKVQVNYAQMERARAELQLLEYQIGQANLVAPFDALVISGDLSQRIGTVVKQGETLFELAPTERYRLALYVDEFRIKDVVPGMTGELVLAALPDQKFSFQVTRITPMAKVRDGKTVYRVEAELASTSDGLQAGLEGVAKIRIDRRHLISIWTRGLRDWLRLELWRLWG